MRSRGLRQLATQTRFDFVLLCRNPLAGFFIVILPIIFLFVLIALFGNELVSPVGPKLATRFVPGLIALAVVQASFVNLAMVTVTWSSCRSTSFLMSMCLPPTTRLR